MRKRKLFFSDQKEIIHSIKFKNKSLFKIVSKSFGEFDLELECPGIHNVYNALAATALSLDMNISISNIKN